MKQAAEESNAMTRWGIASVDAAAHGRPAQELVVTDVDSLVRWHSHDFPHPLARWHAHPEVEIHLITAGSGNAFVGDHVGRFSAGHVVAVGSELPHNWISDLGPNEVVPGRDVVLHIQPERFRRLADLVPEARDALAYFTSIRHGIEYTGATANEATPALRDIGETHGLARVARLFRLLEILQNAPADDCIPLSRQAPTGGSDRIGQERVDAVLAYITANLSDLSLPEAAGIVAMTPSSLSRFFRIATGRGFADTVRHVRIVRASELLTTTDATVLTISQQVGYNNLSNFNRQFRRATGRTPSAYRAAMCLTPLKSGKG